jgi:predicted RNA-binding Zn ribbon-like protein
MSGVNLLFTHDTEVALASAAALVNTLDEHSRDGRVERLPDLPAVNAFMDQWGWTGRRVRTYRELEDVRALRPRLRRIWTGEITTAVAGVNALLAEAHALPQLVTHDVWDYHIHATSPDAPPVDRMAVEAAMALVDVIRQGELDRLKVCAAEDCDNVLADLSKNRSRRFCDAGCGNRANVAAYRARRAGGG